MVGGIIQSWVGPISKSSLLPGKKSEQKKNQNARGRKNTGPEDSSKKGILNVRYLHQRRAPCRKLRVGVNLVRWAGQRGRKARPPSTTNSYGRRREKVQNCKSLLKCKPSRGQNRLKKGWGGYKRSELKMAWWNQRREGKGKGRKTHPSRPAKKRKKEFEKVVPRHPKSNPGYYVLTQDPSQKSWYFDESPGGMIDASTMKKGGERSPSEAGDQRKREKKRRNF